MEIHAYALFTWIGAAAACILALPALKRAGMTTAQAWITLFLMCAGFLAGARLWNVAVNPGNFLGPLKWYTPKLAGLSLYGGVIAAGCVLLLSAKACRVRILPVLDAMAFPGGAAFCFARIGCFLNGCCGGIATNGPFGVVFPGNGSSDQVLPGLLSFVSSRPVHPTQLYELAGAAIGIPMVLLICRRINAKPGTRFFLYAAFFSAVRLAVLPLRALSYSGGIKEVFYPALYAAIVAAGIALALKLNRPERKTQ